MKRWLTGLPRNERLNNWFTPVMIGVAYFVLAVTVRMPESIGIISQWFIVGTYLVLGALWVLIVRSYGHNQRMRAEHEFRFTGGTPPKNVWAMYGEERFENLPTRYAGIDDDGLSVWEVLMPKPGHPSSMGAAMVPGMTTLRVYVGPHHEEDE